MTAERPLPGLRKLAREYGVQTSYNDVDGVRRTPSVEAVMQVLRGLGAPLERPEDIPGALRQRHLERWRRMIEPVIVAWDGRAGETAVRLPASASGPIDCELAREDREVCRWREDVRALSVTHAVEIEGAAYRELRLPLPDMPLGYHRLAVEHDGRWSEALVCAAPRRAHVARTQRSWGVFLPLYALRSGRSWGAGDLTDLDALMSWVDGLGGDVVATLPLLASFLDESYSPSPYAPASRLFWNELFLDVEALPELAECPEARETVASPAFRRRVRRLRKGDLVDYRGVMSLKRRVLESLAERFHEARHRTRAGKELRSYARFRAASEHFRAGWPAWPERARAGTLSSRDYDERSECYHTYVQIAMERQLDALVHRTAERGQRVYLDLPLGVHPDGYDIWRHRDLFATSVSAGAPPDTFFALGQKWGFPPLDPHGLRERGYDYVIAFLRHQLRLARMLRIDHVMSLHRLFWIPAEMEATEGTYVRYRAEELYAILSLESHRHGATIVGENLGTVPSYVNAAMKRHAIQQMYVAQFGLRDADPPLGRIPRDSVASVNTHDLPPFAAYWADRDLEAGVQRGHLDRRAASEQARGRRKARRALLRSMRHSGEARHGEHDAGTALRGTLRRLAEGRARTVLVNLEDLWLETEPQNVPGTVDEYPNWRRKARYSLDEMRRSDDVTEALQEVDALRKRKEA